MTVASEAFDINAFLAQEQSKELLRLTTAGSVDDGKSTLIGRMLHDAKGAYEDQLKSARRGGEILRSSTRTGPVSVRSLATYFAGSQ